jgi:uncharacterized linocin/CFP29 family protein
MPVGLETQVLRGAPRSLLSAGGIAHLRANHARRTEEASLYTNATLLREHWLAIDNSWLRVADQYMGAVMDLTSRGLTQTVPHVGIAASQYTAVGRMDRASRDMRASAASNNQRMSLTPHLVPLPFAYEDYEFDLTELEAIQSLGGGLDLAYAEEAQRAVAEEFETWLVVGAPEFTLDGNTIYGYTTHPNRLLATGADWGTPTNIYPDVLEMVQLMLSINRPGPYGLYLNVLQYGELLATQGTDTIFNMLRRIMESFPQIQSIKPVFAMPAGQGVLAELQRRTVDLAIKMDPANVPWDLMGGLAVHVRILGSIVPRLKADANSQIGVVHISGI